MIDINEETYPLNLLDAVSESAVGWEYPLPTDIDATIEYVLFSFSEKERAVIKMRYQEQKSFNETAEALGLSSSRIRAIESKALRRLHYKKNCELLKYGISGTIERARFEGAENAISLKFLEALESLRQITEALQEIIPDEKLQKMREILGSPKGDLELEELDFTVRTYNVLTRAGVKSLFQLTTMSINDLMKLRNLGKKSYDEIVCKVHSLGFVFKDEEIDSTFPRG